MTRHGSWRCIHPINTRWQARVLGSIFWAFPFLLSVSTHSVEQRVHAILNSSPFAICSRTVLPSSTPARHRSLGTFGWDLRLQLLTLSLHLVLSFFLSTCPTTAVRRFTPFSACSLLHSRVTRSMPSADLGLKRKKTHHHHHHPVALSSTPSPPK